MSAPTTTWQWPTEVLAYAAQQGVENYLEPVREAILRVYPTAQGMRVYREDDPELRDVRWIVFEVEVPDSDLKDYVGLFNRWCDELYRVCPSVLTHHFGLQIRRAKP